MLKVNNKKNLALSFKFNIENKINYTKIKAFFQAILFISCKVLVFTSTLPMNFY